MKKTLAIIAIVLLTTGTAYAGWLSDMFSSEPVEELQLGAPSLIYQRTILPETDGTYSLGASGREWLNLFTDGLTAANATTTNATTTNLYVTNRLGVATSSPFKTLSVAGDIWVSDGGSIDADYLANNGIFNRANMVIDLARVNEGAGITMGEPVYINGVTGDKPQVGLASNLVHDKAHVFGLALDSGVDGELIRVQTFGELRDINTSTYSTGLLHLADGTLQNAVPTSGAHVHVGWVTKVNANDGIIEVEPDQYSHDFRATSDLNLKFALGTIDNTSFGIFEDYIGEESGWWNGSGQLSWGTPTTTASTAVFKVATTTGYNLVELGDSLIIDSAGLTTINNIEFPTLFNDKTDPTGFLNRENVISFASSTRTFSIAGDHDIYINAVKSTKSATTTIIADTTGLHWAYYDADGLIQNTTVFPGWQFPTIASIYWNTVIDEGILADERHSYKMAVDTHTYNHDTVGVRYDTKGGGLTGTFDDTTLSITAGAIYDEDIKNSIPLSTENYVLYKNGAADFEFSTTTTPYHTVGGVLQYNNGNALTNVDNSKFTCEWVFASNATTTPIMTIIGQRQDLTLQTARNNCTFESLAFGALPSWEMKILYRVIYKNVGGTPTWQETQDLRALSNTPAGSFVATSHATLSDLSYTLSGHTGFAGLAVDNTFTGGNIFGNSTTTNATTTSMYISGVVNLLGETFTNFTTYVRSLFTGGNSITITAGSIAVDDDFLLNDGDIGTGVYDFGGATSFEITNNGTVNANGEITLDDTTGQLRGYAGSAERVYVPFFTTGFTYATSTAWTGTTTKPYLAPAAAALTLTTAYCETDTGTANVSVTDGTNRLDLINASTTIGTFTFSTNNTFTAGESIRVEVGTPASTPTLVSCRFKGVYTAD